MKVRAASSIKGILKTFEYCAVHFEHTIEVLDTASDDEKKAEVEQLQQFVSDMAFAEYKRSKKIIDGMKPVYWQSPVD